MHPRCFQDILALRAVELWGTQIGGVGEMRNLLQMLVVISFVLVQHPAIAATDYEIEAGSNDETFIINDEFSRRKPTAWDGRKTTA
jgi:hypothetical protein